MKDFNEEEKLKDPSEKEKWVHYVWRWSEKKVLNPHGSTNWSILVKNESDQNETITTWMDRERWYLLIQFEGFWFKGKIEGCQWKRKMDRLWWTTMMDRLCLEMAWKRSRKTTWGWVESKKLLLLLLLLLLLYYYYYYYCYYYHCYWYSYITITITIHVTILLLLFMLLYYYYYCY